MLYYPPERISVIAASPLRPNTGGKGATRASTMAKSASRRWHIFDRTLAAPIQDLTITFRGLKDIPPSDFLLNPRRLRGSDFLMRWSQGVWSEQQLRQAVNDTGSFVAYPYGPSSTAPDDDIRSFELYFERLEKCGLGNLKRPDLLIFRRDDIPVVERAIQHLGGIEKLPFTEEDHPQMTSLLDHALIAVECENSLWRARKMPDYSTPMRPQKRLNGKLGLKKTAVLPTIIVKEEDRNPLKAWQQQQGIAIHVWHAFYDEAYGIPLDTIDQLISEGTIEPTRQVFQAPGGATTQKLIYKVYYHYAYKLSRTLVDPDLVADFITDKNGHILPYVRFVNGKSQLCKDAIEILKNASPRR